MYCGKKKNEGVSIDDGYKQIYSTNATPLMQLLSCIYHANLHSSVPCEDGFHLLGRIKTKLRSSMSQNVVDNLMTISSNGPDLNSPEFSELLDRAYEHWCRQAKRCLARSHPGVSRKRKAAQKSIPLADLLNAEIRAARHEQAAQRTRAMRGFSSESEMSDASEKSDEASDESDVELPVAKELVASHGAFAPPHGYRVLPPPTLDTYRKMHTALAWSNKKVAHIFDNGWHCGTFRGPRKVVGGVEWEIYYSDDRRKWKHELPLGEYGCDRTWVIIERLPVRRSKRACQ